MLKRGKAKSQVALEFLMTYGWAVMVALIAVGTLAYFGILNPDRFYPTACTLEPGIGCTDFKVSEGEITLVLKNGKGEDIDISGIQVKNCTGTASGTLKNGKQATLIIDGCRNKPGAKFVSDLNITFASESGLVHKKTGRIVGLVEPGGATTCDEDIIVTYGDWGSCSVSCGGGTQTRTNVNQCGQSVQETQSCNTQPCCDPNAIVSCEDWGQCSTSCGSGTQTRSCTNQCGSAITQTQSCYDNSGASAVSGCTDWSGCSASCGYGTQTRTCYYVCGGSYTESLACVGSNGIPGEPCSGGCNLAQACHNGQCYRDSGCGCTLAGCWGDVNEGNSPSSSCRHYTCTVTPYWQYCDASFWWELCGQYGGPPQSQIPIS